MLVSCVYKACSFPVQRPQWSTNAPSCKPSTSGEAWVGSSIPDASSWFFLNVSGNRGSPTSSEPFSTLVKRSFSCQRCRVTFWCPPDLFELNSCLLYVVHQLSGRQSLGVLPDGWGSLGLEGASWHPQSHLPDWDPIPNLPVALTQSHFTYVCWISFQRAAKEKYAPCMSESSCMF